MLIWGKNSISMCTYTTALWICSAKKHFDICCLLVNSSKHSSKFTTLILFTRWVVFYFSSVTILNLRQLSWTFFQNTSAGHLAVLIIKPVFLFIILKTFLTKPTFLPYEMFLNFDDYWQHIHVGHMLSSETKCQPKKLNSRTLDRPTFSLVFIRIADTLSNYKRFSL